jgi:hypothetical protein
MTYGLVERALEVELTEHLGYEPHLEPPGGAGNTRNGSTPKTLITDQGKVPLDTPRDRNGHVRAEDRPQAPAPVRRLRREDPRLGSFGASSGGDRWSDAAFRYCCSCP